MYVEIDTLFFADVFENFCNKCLEIYELDPSHFSSELGLAWQACLKKKEIELESLTDIDMLWEVEKGIRRGKCHSIHRYAIINNTYLKEYNKDKESSYVIYLDANVSKINC